MTASLLRRHGVRVCAVLALGASALLLVDSLRVTPAVCGFGSGCEAVRRSSLGRLLGVPTPILGIAAFGTLLALTLVPGARAQRTATALALVGGAIGFGLLVAQGVVFRAWCLGCVVVDASAIGAAAFAIAGASGGGEAGDLGAATPTGRRRLGWILAAVVSVALPLGVGLLAPLPPVPPEIRARWVAGRVNVVEVTDVECVHCRALHTTLSRVLAEDRTAVHLVRILAPLPGHEGGRRVALAVAAAASPAEAEALVDALFGAPVLDDAGIVRTAGGAGVPEDRLRAALADPATRARADATAAEGRAAAKAVGAPGVPVLWIGDRVFYGEQNATTIRRALEAAKAGGAGGG